MAERPAFAKIDNRIETIKPDVFTQYFVTCDAIEQVWIDVEVNRYRSLLLVQWVELFQRSVCIDCPFVVVQRPQTCELLTTDVTVRVRITK